MPSLRQATCRRGARQQQRDVVTPDRTVLPDRTLWSTIEYPDLDGDGRADICARANEDVFCALFTGTALERRRSDHRL